jgi:hypothetical protein
MIAQGSAHFMKLVDAHNAVRQNHPRILSLNGYRPTGQS